MLLEMVQVMVELDDATAARLERVAPARSRRRLAFIRMAVRRALDEEAERATERAYREQPDAAAPVNFDPAAWESHGAPHRY
jgi:predicted transcriptional regulator